MFCRNCGTRLADDASFCVQCGTQRRASAQIGGPPQFHPAYHPAYHPDAKSRIAAGLLGIFLGSMGIHRFYLGYVGVGILQIIATAATCGFGGIWGFVEGIVILAGGFDTDAQGRPLRD